MPCDLSSGANNIISFGGDQNSCLNSSMNTAGILTILIIVIILIMYPCSKKAKNWDKIKTFMYIFGTVYFILILHKGTITKALDSQNKNDASSKLIEGFGSATITGTPVAVEPRVGGHSMGGDESTDSFLTRHGV